MLSFIAHLPKTACRVVLHTSEMLAEAALTTVMLASGPRFAAVHDLRPELRRASVHPQPLQAPPRCVSSLHHFALVLASRILTTIFDCCMLSHDGAGALELPAIQAKLEIMSPPPFQDFDDDDEDGEEELEDDAADELLGDIDPNSGAHFFKIGDDDRVKSQVVVHRTVKELYSVWSPLHSCHDTRTKLTGGQTWPWRTSSIVSRSTKEVNKCPREFYPSRIHDSADEVWTKSRQQGLIDSLFKGCPIPAVVLAAKRSINGTEYFNVIDGKQRLTTITKFMRGKVRLRFLSHGIHFLIHDCSWLVRTSFCPKEYVFTLTTDR
jgi:hypothetical protein